jgi:hypothetical protein
MAISDFLNQTATILAEAPYGVQPPQTAMGGADRWNWITVADGVPCLLRTRTNVLAAYAGKRNDSRQQQIGARIYFEGDPVPEGISSRHRIVLSECPRPADNGTYAVIGAIDPDTPTDQDRLLEVDVERVRKP